MGVVILNLAVWTFSKIYPFWGCQLSLIHCILGYLSLEDGMAEFCNNYKLNQIKLAFNFFIVAKQEFCCSRFFLGVGENWHRKCYVWHAKPKKDPGFCDKFAVREPGVRG